ncbi:hypothetical protein FDP41_011070 [Naegleria fowleri]|uniref:Thiolase N-terminal domain-containing protein n=1 Tax=Naegleria fowleri TaxID=5763 RepID=A0A6A5C850_NAEFO|nr:uncharacterized protein FDP41_011070 [Naegleria fowleri]KAF0983092.1 hypothetical protein FDP41_011070 [Naegleria fowleri]CAG4710224.1 unnamed protein product [Naegleria fowleri]
MSNYSSSSSCRRLSMLQQHLFPSSSSLETGLNDSSSFSFGSFSERHGSEESMIGFNETSASSSKKRKAVIVCGARTPFVKAFGDLMEVDSIGLGVSAVEGLLKKSKLDPNLIDEIIWGNVVLNTKAPNVAREIVIDLNLPKKITGVTVSRACLSGLEAILQGIRLIEHGQAEVVVAGGSDSMSNGEMALPRNLTLALGKYNYGKDKGTMKGLIQLFKDAGSPLSWIPTPPAIAERSTGKTMGYHADMMAELNRVTRNTQDQFAAQSHKNAAKARREGKLDEEIVPVRLKNGKVVARDNLIREDSDASKMSKLKPVFRKTGTVTAASSSPLTDGASCVLVMSEEKARELGYPVDIRISSYATTAVDPYPQLLLAPVLAFPKVLDDAGITLDQVDLFEIHEAFAAQVLSTTACLASDEFCQKRLGRSKAIGVIPPEKLNINGSSIAIGHPFSATGGRLVTSAMNELRRTGKKYAILSVCAAGGLGGVALVERVSDNK